MTGCSAAIIIQGGPALGTKPLEKLFQHKVLRMLLRKGKINQEVVNLIMSWRHFSFNVHCGPRIQPGDEEAMERVFEG